MADVTIYVPEGTTVDVIQGEPPVDQSGELAALQAKIAAADGHLTTVIAEAQAAKDALA